MRTVLLSQLVNSTFRDTIAPSSCLKRYLWLEPTLNLNPTFAFNPLFFRHAPQGKIENYPLRIIEGQLGKELDVMCYSDVYEQRPRGSWEDMIVAKTGVARGGRSYSLGTHLGKNGKPRFKSIDAGTQLKVKDIFEYAGFVKEDVAAWECGSETETTA